MNVISLFRAGLAEMNIRAPIISEPGLIRREYEAERLRIEEEARKRQEQEAQASEKLIKELQVFFCSLTICIIKVSNYYNCWYEHYFPLPEV